MSWVVTIALAVAGFVLAAFALKAPRKGWEAIAAALLFGIAGYGLHGSPSLPGAPKAAPEDTRHDKAVDLAKERQAMSDKGIPPNNQWVVIADALARNGRFADSAEVLRGAVEADPGNSEAWLSMANSLVAHSEGMLTPAAIYAYRRATKAAPDSPGPPFFLGLAMAQNGRFSEARTIWAGLLERAPKDAPWRADLADKLQSLDRFIAAQRDGSQP